MVIVVMGVAGSGKSTVGALLARRLGMEFVDADDFHSPANVARMRAGLPLDDDARAPWLDALRRAIDRWLAEGRGVVLACSALRASYRRHLGTGRPSVRLVYLHGEPALLQSRLASRGGHFAGPGLLPSQLAALEPPGPDEALRVDVARPPEVIVDELAAEFLRSAT